MRTRRMVYPSCILEPRSIWHGLQNKCYPCIFMSRRGGVFSLTSGESCTWQNSDSVHFQQDQLQHQHLHQKEKLIKPLNLSQNQEGILNKTAKIPKQRVSKRMGVRRTMGKIVIRKTLSHRKGIRSVQRFFKIQVR